MKKSKNLKKAQPRVFRLLPDFNPGCTACSLANKGAIGGHTFGPLQDIELLIVAAYPAKEEIKKGFSLAPNERRPNIDKPNAGRYVKYSIIHAFDNDPDFPEELKPFYGRIAFSNMIKCSPFNARHEKMDVTDKHVRTCKQTWLEKEIAQISKFNPTCPILLCGSEAVKLLGPKMKVYSNRRKLFTYNNTHPVLVTFNPVEVCRYTSYRIAESKTTSKGQIVVEKVLPEKPLIVGSTGWHWLQDMKHLKKLVLSNYLYKQSDNKSGFGRLMEYFNNVT